MAKKQDGTVKVTKRGLFLVTLLMFVLGFALSSMCRAEEVKSDVITTPAFDFVSASKALRLGYAFNQHGQKSTIYYTHLQWYNDVPNEELINFNIGYEVSSEYVCKRPLIQIGGRLDNLIPKIWGGAWGKAHITTVSLPTMEFGPYVSAWPRKVNNKWTLDLFYGLAGAIGFK